MKTIIVLGLIAMSCCHLLDSIAITRDHVEEIKEFASFETYSYEEHPFKDLSVFELRAKLGLKGLPLHELKTLPKGNTADLPENFDSRVEFKDCVHEIRDQQSCGSCWAFAASEVLSDRFCIASKGEVNVVLSPQDMVSCDDGDFGCDGGYLDVSFDYLVKQGIVSDACYPYTAGSGIAGACKVNKGKCAVEGVEYKKYKASKWYQFESVEEIKRDIQENGPIETGFTVYQDFMSYKSGIYRKSSNTVLGGHAVKIVGWGKEKDAEYWIVANSWGPKWGEQGHFRIAINNCCNFEAQAIAATADHKKVTEFLQ